MSKPKKWTKSEIKKQLEDRKMTLTGLAELNGLNPNTFRADDESRRAALAIKKGGDVVEQHNGCGAMH